MSKRSDPVLNPDRHVLEADSDLHDADPTDPDLQLWL
jgi:hypothetical protein